MGLIPIDDIVPDMILASDLRSPQGRLLLPEGTNLNEKHLQIFKTWGVLEADINGVSADELDDEKLNQFDPEVLDTCNQLAAKRFAEVDQEQGAMHELMRLFTQRTSQRICALGHKRVWEEQFGAPEALQALAGNTGPLKPISPTFIAGREVALASLPDIYMQICEAINNPRSSAAFVAEVISNDMSLSAKLLRLVNSAFYGFPSKIDTLSRAVTIIGTNQLSTLALGISITSMFDGIPADLMDMRSFWKHCVACGIISRFMASQVPGMNEERFFVAGLLHDVGRLVMLKNYSLHVGKALLRADAQQCQLARAESDTWGFNHATLAGELLRQWKFPTTLEESIKYHHLPSRAPSLKEPGILHLADIIANGLAIGCSGSRSVMPLDNTVWEALGFSKSILPMVVSQIDFQLDELIRIFFKGNEQ